MAESNYKKPNSVKKPARKGYNPVTGMPYQLEDAIEKAKARQAKEQSKPKPKKIVAVPAKKWRFLRD